MAEALTTVAAFKRAMVPGTFWHTTHNFKDRPEKDMGIRECVVAQSNSFGFRNPDTGATSWCGWPKKAEFHQVDADTIKIVGEGAWMTLVYRRVPPPAYVINEVTGEKWVLPSVKDAEDFIEGRMAHDAANVVAGHYSIDDMSIRE